ncbi:carbamoyltransferase [Streptomyces sp. NPDC056257]|uniref:carbamoyltransferase family protein n=1 Tax=Streptomyces sp. NPDC056257 TaxID=3345765 RepID=UPI0035E0F775
MRYWGISALSHDASLAVVEDGRVVFAGHSERYSRKKNDPLLHEDLLAEAAAFGPPDRIAWYERPLLKKLRHARAGQWNHAASASDLPRRYLAALRLPFPVPEIAYADHHGSHAAAGFATSAFEDAAVVVADSIGEFRTFTIGHARRGRPLSTLHRRSYPHSLGLLYSAFTRRCGFRPNEDEYVIMGMAAYGRPLHVDAILEDLVELTPPTFRLKRNVHRGIGDWLPGAAAEDLAASVQRVVETVMLGAATWAGRQTRSRNLVLSGGIALNCVVNSMLAREAGFDDVWILPNPGDAGSSIGAVAAVTGERLVWPGPYLGTPLAGDYPVAELLGELDTNGLVGVANGRGEFGPRALGNRSILADPRPPGMKDRVNEIKGRERFRPFAPVVRAERVHELFDLPVAVSPYMQFTAQCRSPADYPAIVHRDGTSRVQTVERTQHPGLYALLEEWEARTGCPVLLNTSLNGRGEPLLNSAEDVRRFTGHTGLPVY